MSNALKKNLALFFLAIIFLIPLANIFWQNLHKSVWDGSHHLTVAIDNGTIDLWSIEPSQKHITHVIVPQNTSLSVGSYGMYRAKALGKLSLQERHNGSLFVQ